MMLYIPPFESSGLQSFSEYRMRRSYLRLAGILIMLNIFAPIGFFISMAGADIGVVTGVVTHILVSEKPPDYIPDCIHPCGCSEFRFPKPFRDFVD